MGEAWGVSIIKMDGAENEQREYAADEENSEKCL
jgi:hypothetical protein